MPDPYAALAREVDMLDRRLRGWTQRSWSVRLPGGATRSDLVASLAERLDALGREAGVPVPAGAVLPRVADHALADQVLVLAADLLAASEHAGATDAARRAAGAVREVRDLLARASRPRG